MLSYAITTTYSIPHILTFHIWGLDVFTSVELCCLDPIQKVHNRVTQSDQSNSVQKTLWTFTLPFRPLCSLDSGVRNSSLSLTSIPARVWNKGMNANQFNEHGSSPLYGMLSGRPTWWTGDQQEYMDSLLFTCNFTLFLNPLEHLTKWLLHIAWQ